MSQAMKELSILAQPASGSQGSQHHRYGQGDWSARKSSLQALPSGELHREPARTPKQVEQDCGLSNRRKETAVDITPTTSPSFELLGDLFKLMPQREHLLCSGLPLRSYHAIRCRQANWAGEIRREGAQGNWASSDAFAVSGC